jgi:hypothetical protein
MRKKNTHHIKKSLVFTHIEKRDEGVYICEAQLQGRTVKREIRIHVAGKISIKKICGPASFWITGAPPPINLEENPWVTG